MNKKKTYLLTTLALLILAIPRLLAFYADYLWFDAQQYSSVFFTTLTYQVTTFVAAAIITYAALAIVVSWTNKNLQKHDKEHKPSALEKPAIIAASLLVAVAYAAQWETILRYLNSFSFQKTDPVFSKDIAFYVYELPFYELLTNFTTLLVTLAFITALALYAIHLRPKVVRMQEEPEIPLQPTFSLSYFNEQIKKHAYPQLLILASLILLTNATSYFLERYNLLFSSQGTVYGVGFTEAIIRLPALWILATVSILAAILLLYNIKAQQDKHVLTAIVAVIAISILATLAGVVTQSLIVEPDEQNKELPYIEHEISYTRAAYALDKIQREELEISEELSREQLRRHEPTIQNVRLWDDRPLLRTLNEIQIFRTYYTFRNVDVDRYDINGERTLMMLAAREMDTRALPAQSQTWVNHHLVYTHGFGAVMSPASQVTQANLPALVIQDIPPRSNVPIEITQPRIYYGENTNNYVIVNTKTAELDYPSGEENIRIHYPGEGGVLLDNTFKRLTYAAYFTAPQIFFSDSITRESRIQYNRQITQRARTLAPFLQYDNDPYIVIGEDGALYWIQDAYTTTNKYPYSKPYQNINYIRNSAKAIINAYDGTTTFYIADKQDPLIQTYKQAYPALFKDFEKLPAGLEKHVRYPQDIFSIQAEMYRDYHMTQPTVFYNREDTWRIPNEVVRGVEQRLRPYYQIMQLPGYEEAEFIQVQPFIPQGRENLIGWLAARSDVPHYGELIAYHFSKQELTFGPMQIESRIDQDTDISQQITLWSRAGSGVVRGNLLVIPIEDTILYVEPLFLEAREQGALPQLMRVIVVHNDRIAMAPTIQQALDAITDPSAPATIIDESPTVITDTTRITEIREAYQRAQEALNKGDLRAYADRLEELERLLE
ncbi:MAG: UPF0182 family protein [Candidatus Woesearchaeota archaeon]